MYCWTTFWWILTCFGMFFAVVCDDLLVIRMLDRNMSINMLLILCIPDGIADCTWDVILAFFLIPCPGTSKTFLRSHGVRSRIAYKSSNGAKSQISTSKQRQRMQHVFVVHCNGMQTLGIATEVDMPIYSYESLRLFFWSFFSTSGLGKWVSKPH